MHSRRHPWIAFLTAFALAFLAAASALADSTSPLFFIQRSKNKNEIHYDVHLTANGGLDPKNPVEAYWLRLASDGSRGPITLMQRIAYGFDVEQAKDGTYKMKLTALKKRPLTLVQVNGKWRAQAAIGGKAAYLHHLYVATDESGLIPSVRYIDIFGEEVGTGKPVQERIEK